MPNKTIKNAYNAGELSPYLDGRTDLAKYFNGCSQLVNFTPIPQGGAVKRPGTEYIATAKAKTRLIPFEFSTTDTHILEFGANYIRFFKSGAASVKAKTDFSNWVTATAYVINDLIEDNVTGDKYYYCAEAHTSGTLATDISAGKWILMTDDPDDATNVIYEIFTEYSATEVFGFHYVQSADVMFIAHVDVHPMKLTRLGDTNWTIVDVNDVDGPFRDENVTVADVLVFTATAFTTGTHTAAGNNATVMTDSGAAFTVDALIGQTIVNTTDGSAGVITDNDATTVTVAALTNGTDNDWDTSDAYTIIDLATEQGFFHATDSTGTLTATGGHTPFNVNHIGSHWDLHLTRLDNYVTLAGAVSTGATSSSILIKGDFSVDATGFGDEMVVSLQREVLNGDFQNHRKFTAAVAFSDTELEDDVLYRIKIDGTAIAATNVTLVAKDQDSHGIVEITDFSTSTSVSATVKTDLFSDVSEEVDIAKLRYGKTADVEVTTTASHGLSNGDIVLVKNISRPEFSGLNFDADENNVYIVVAVTATVFRLFDSAGDVEGDNADNLNTGVGEYYLIKQTSTTIRWAEDSWSIFRGYPRTVNFHEDRLWWASNDAQPQTLWGSKTSEYEKLKTGIFDNDGINFTLNDRDVSQIQWLISKTLLAVGTASKEYVLSASNPDNPITPSDIKAKNQSAYGSNTIQPMILNDAVFFHQRSGKKLRALKFDLNTFSLTAIDVTILNNTILELSATTMAVQKIPDSIVWMTRSDGTLLGFTYEPEEDVLGWSEHITGTTLTTIPIGIFESVARISGSIEDEIWVSVQRVINGSTVRYIERFTTRFADQLDEAVHVDSALLVTTGESSKNIIVASDTVRCGFGLCNSSLCGGTIP